MQYTLSVDEEKKWEFIIEKLSAQFAMDVDLESAIFIIGLQELGKGYVKLNKDQKLDTMHVAICTLLEPYGFYLFLGKDEAGWPHWQRTEKLPHLKPAEQSELMKSAIVNYFESIEFF
jgi:hypothetical protein